MNSQKLILLLTFTLFGFTVNSSTNSFKSLNSEICKPLLLLNKSTKLHLQLSDTDMKVVHEINHQYLAARRKILNTPDMIGQNTALLTCWDNWRRSLEKHLNQSQMKQFANWQAKADLLSRAPF